MTDQLVEVGRDALRAAGRAAPFDAGARLIRAGEVSDEVLLVEAGAIKVVLAGADGTETLAGVCGPGELVGESGVIGRRPRSAHVIALTAGRATHIAGSAFQRLVDANAAVRHLVDKTLDDRRQVADDRQLRQAHDVLTRVGTVLLAWARSVGTPTTSGLLVHGLSQRDIAQAVTASEKSVEAALGTLRAAGVLTTRRLAIRITRPEELARLMSGPDRRSP
ncbi:Crp/Fnr family transcriptional regulator [Umezawaea sp. Da 62-37]|uniref:Crp/Fnr family transcriptional regulator n=1 Tax=Umezawaea sp. Da 62-37 TaxID=3075927 RepID=UPI0028F6EEA3|nr:Crp/Fnr family transcriptional regulator [Umezawaea sp. Da 62-37]WNV83404.1 Crp/Fnr family transcriptional regulator [Umezawaea sp. Da 62-37]